MIHSSIPSSVDLLKTPRTGTMANVRLNTIYRSDYDFFSYGSTDIGIRFHEKVQMSDFTQPEMISQRKPSNLSFSTKES